jgi:DNA-binding NtrC family response regulator
MAARILVVEDDAVLNRLLVQRLTREGYVAEGVRTGAEARATFGNDWDLIVFDLRLPDARGLDLLREARERFPDQLALVMTAEASVESAVEAIRLGAQDYLKKPFEADELLIRVKRALETKALQGEVAATRQRSRKGAGLESLVGSGSAMRDMRELIRRVAASDTSTVLITGESGSGKDMAAKAIHFESRRADEPFMTITCTTISEQLLESELFGHEKGAFTNASSQKKGLFELADGGTVFLDEIGDLSLPLQGKLLRFLQEKAFKRVGGTRDIHVDVRIVAATHQPLPARVEQGRFRQDLFYRLKVVDLVVPPLRARADDVPALAWTFVRALNAELRRDVQHVAPDAVARMLRYAWPGNVRELKNAVERAMILGCGTTIFAADLPVEVRNVEVSAREIAEAEARQRLLESASGAAPTEPAAAAPHAVVESAAGGDWIYLLPAGGVDLGRLERELLLQAITRTKGNRTHAGRLLGLNRDQVRYRLEKSAITDPENPSSTGAG